MTPADRAAAQAALSEGRGVYSRLDQIRGPEDAAADIMDLWGASEDAMRALLGGSTLSGQALVRELRTRGVIDLAQANALASFWDARSRVDDVAYKPTLTDVGYARMGFNELTRAVNEPANATAAAPAAPGAAGAASSPWSGPAAAAATGATVGAGVGAATGGRPAGPAIGATPPPAGSTVPPTASVPRAVPAVRRSPLPLIVGLVVLVAALLGAAAYFTMGGSSYDKEMTDATTLMQTSRVEAARAAFTKIANEHPDKAAPHVFLSRLARTDGDTQTALHELDTAIRIDPTYEPAMREMGLVQLAQNHADLARSFFIRAVKLDTADHAAQGYLACALIRLNRTGEAQTFLQRAGTGAWSTCATGPRSAATGTGTAAGAPSATATAPRP